MRTRLFALPLLLAGCSAPRTNPTAAAVASETPLITTLSAPRVSAVGAADPDAAFWSEVEAGHINLLAQPMILPRPEVVTTDSLRIQAAHDGKTLAFRLSWKDAEPSEAGHLGEFSDAVAVEFPLREGPPPPVFMGGLGAPVHIFHWRAQYQRDAEKGKPTMEELYPNASVDMYAMDFHDAPGGSRDEREMFNPAVALGNPQSNRKSGLDEVVAEGFSTSSVQAGHDSAAVGRWKDGQWSVALTRPLVIEGAAPIAPGGSTYVAFAVWQGGKGEVGSRKSVLMSWLPLQVAR